MFKTTSRNGFHMTFANGCTVSVQWNSGNYCSDRELFKPYNPDPEPRECATVEVGAWDASGAWIKLSENDDVIGWQNADDVAAIIAKLAAL